MKTSREASREYRNRNTERGPDAGLVFLARRGIAEAQFQLGEMYQMGEGGARYDPSASVRWFRAAAEQDHIDAQMYLAEAYHQGEGVSQDSEEAARWFRAAAEWGCDDASLRLGIMYADAKANMYADIEAEARLEVAAIAGHDPARYLLRVLHAENDDGPGDYRDPEDSVRYREPGKYDPDPEEMRRMAEELLQRAWGEDMDAQCGVALAYQFGLGVARDVGEAIRWFRAAARQGDGSAQSNLGVIHYHGEGVPKPDHEVALRWFRAAAGLGDPRGLFNLAGMHYNGDGGLPRDPVKAVQFVREASERGYREAQNSLGVAYYNGEGIKRNEQESVRWFRAAVVQGSRNAACNLAALCVCGKGGLENQRGSA